MPQKILIFHGFGSNDLNAHSQTPNLRKSLEDKGYSVHYVKAPILLKDSELPDIPGYDRSRGALRGWWYLQDGTLGEGLSVTEQHIRSKYGDDDEIVGVIGISQGASLTGLIVANRWIPSLKFGVAYGGYIYPLFGYEIRDAYKNKIRVPYLSVMGQLDTVVVPDDSVKFAHEFVEDKMSTLLTHEGGHVFAEGDEDVETVSLWIDGVVNN